MGRRSSGHWYGPFGIWGFSIDEEAEGERQHLFYKRWFVHGIPRAFLCRRFGHRPVVDGYGSWPNDPTKPWRKAARWVACGRCDQRPDAQGNLPPALFPTLGALYKGEWADPDDHRRARAVIEQRREEWYEQIRAQRGLPDPQPVPQPDFDLISVWPLNSWDGHDKDRPGPRGNAHFDLLLWQRRRRDWPGYGLGFSLGAGEQPIKFHVHAGKLGSLYVGFEQYGRALAHRILGRDMPETRVFEIDWTPADWTLRWEVAARKHEWSSKDPKWMQGHIDFANLILGRPESTTHVIDSREVMLPLPEGRYPATVELKRHLARRARLPRVTTTYYAEVTPVCGVPVPGKGENSYDCEDDAHYGGSQAVGGPEYGNEWVTQAVSKFAASVLRDRARYGSGLEWTPDAGWPAELVGHDTPA